MAMPVETLRNTGTESHSWLRTALGAGFFRRRQLRWGDGVLRIPGASIEAPLQPLGEE